METMYREGWRRVLTVTGMPTLAESVAGVARTPEAAASILTPMLTATVIPLAFIDI